MRLSPIGLAALGVGDGVVSVDGVVIDTHAGEVAWQDEDRLVYAKGATLQRFNAADSTIVQISPQGANRVRAGGGIWAAWLNGAVRTSEGHGWESGYRLAEVSDEGTVVLTPESLSGLEFFRHGTQISSMPTASLRNTATGGIAVRLVEGVLLYGDAEGWHLSEGDVEHVIAPRTEEIYWAVPVPVGMEIWILSLIHISEPTRQAEISYAVFCLKKKK